MKVVWWPDERAEGDVWALVWQIHYSADTARNCHPEWQPYNNGGYKLDGTGLGDHWFENSVIRSLHGTARPAWEQADYVGVLSHKITAKTGVTPADWAALMQQHPGLDTYWAGDPPTHYNHFELACHFHGQLRELCEAVFPHLEWGEFDPTVKFPSVYCNYWLARPEIFDRYVTEVLVPVMDLIDTDPNLRAIAMTQTSYITGNVPLPILKKLTGHPWYTCHTFLVERLFGYWATLNGLTAGRVNRINRQHRGPRDGRLEIINHGQLTFA